MKKDRHDETIIIHMINNFFLCIMTHIRIDIFIRKPIEGGILLIENIKNLISFLIFLKKICCTMLFMLVFSIIITRGIKIMV